MRYKNKFKRLSYFSDPYLFPCGQGVNILQHIKARKIVGIVLSLFIILMAAALDYYSFYDFPDEIRIIKGKQQSVELNIPITFQLLCDQKENLEINGLTPAEGLNINLKEPLVLRSSEQGIYNLRFNLFGVIPVKKMRVFVLPEKKVVPGGHSLGVKLRPDGVIVVGFASVTGHSGQRHSPAQDAGIQIGDTITMVNNKKINGADDLARIVNDTKDNPINLTLKRREQIINLVLEPVKNKSNNYQLGLWVRDIAAGVGTLTFYDPETGLYGALGHVISDADTGKVIELGEGEIIRSRVTSIYPGRKNQPGEKRGVFINESNIMGNIMANTPFGIFGRAYSSFNNPVYDALPIAPISQVREGNAKILTVLEGETIGEYDIEIEKIIKQASPNSKGMIIKVTDPELIKQTGGIIQGMSGSPIIKDGYLVGAVTHVFVNDPTKGYGVFAEWMFNEINTLEGEKLVM